MMCYCDVWCAMMTNVLFVMVCMMCYCDVWCVMMMQCVVPYAWCSMMCYCDVWCAMMTNVLFVMVVYDVLLRRLVCYDDECLVRYGSV